MFDMVLFFKKNSPEVTPTVIAECWNDCLNFSHLNPPQRQAYFDIKNKKVPTCEEKDKINSKTEIANAVHAGRMEYLFKIIHELVSDNDKDFLQYLSMLITLNSKERKELANSGEPCGIVAEASLYMHPASIISLYALVKNMDFWSMWDLLPASKYEDIDFKEHKDDKKPVLPIEYYKFMRRKNQDEFLEFWDGENLLLSDNLLASITDWNKKIAQASDISPESINRFLSDIIFDLNNDWKCRLVDKEFVELILSNRNDATYRKALRVLRDLMDEDTKLFPELTRKQAIDWIICNYRDTHDRIRLSAYQSLLTNKQQRKKTLNF
jgi:hypothetical protein